MHSHDHHSLHRLLIIAGAYHDVVTKFFHGEIKSSDSAVTELVKALNNAK